MRCIILSIEIQTASKIVILQKSLSEKITQDRENCMDDPGKNDVKHGIITDKHVSLDSLFLFCALREHSNRLCYDCWVQNGKQVIDTGFVLVGSLHIMFFLSTSKCFWVSLQTGRGTALILLWWERGDNPNGDGLVSLS